MTNVLFFITDQQRADHVGFMGNEIVRTPNLDAVAQTGMVFDDGWVANPICMPNRSSIMTGRLPSAHGCIFNDRSLDWNSNTFVRRFRAAGYRTALIGKSHLQHGPSRNSVVPARTSGVFSTAHHQSGWDCLEDFEEYLDGKPSPVEDYYGFDHVEFSLEHGSSVRGHHLNWALEKGGRYEDLVVPMTDESPALDRSKSWWQIYRAPYEAEFHSTTFVADRTIAFIEEAVSQDRPFLAWSSFPDPHHPMAPPGLWFDQYHASEMSLPESIDDPPDFLPPHLQQAHGRHPSDQRVWVQPCGVGGDHGLVREAIAATYGMIGMIDEAVGRVIATLDRLRKLDETIIVFTSDHGDMMGEHGLMLKGSMPFRGTQHVPMFIVAPGFKQGRTESLACSMDLGPTLMELCDIEAYDGIQGVSLVPILNDPHASVRDHVLIEEDFPELLASRMSAPAKTRTLVTKEARYTRNSDGHQMLFDNSEDPLERTELSQTDEPLRQKLMEEMTDAFISSADGARGAPVDPSYG
ncbi:MAG: sulfatase [Acidimicrobiaceae bacterium]|nr:sulfatase [Acidimicrobiaceae bacterium]